MNGNRNSKAAFLILTLPALAFAAAVQAEEGVHGSVTAGVASVQVDNPSNRFGRFSGVTDDTVYFVGAADVQSRNGARYWDFSADDVGLDTRRFRLGGGETGRFKFRLNYEELDNLLSNNSKTPFNSAGSGTLTLPSGFVKNASTSGMTTLASSLKSVDLGTKRKEGEAALSWAIDQNLDISASFRRQLKQGTKSIGGALGAYGGGTSAVILPEPVDYETDEFRAGLAWRNDRAQAKVDYYFSRFSNDNPTLTWDAPFLKYAGVPNYPTVARLSLPPDNEAQRLSVSGSYNFSRTTRLSAVAEWGSMYQNMALLPYTINPGVTITSPLPHSSAEARIDTTLLKLDLNSQPLPKLNLNARYRYYQTDNKTPRDLYRVVVNDTGIQPNGAVQAPVNSWAAAYNRPFDYFQNQLNLDGSYHFGWGTTAKFGYERDERDYKYRSVKATQEDIWSARMNKRWNAGATLNLDLSRGRKRNDGGYNESSAYGVQHTPEYLATLAANVRFDNLLAMRQFDIADRDRWKQGVGLTLVPHQNLTVGLNVARLKDEYNASQFGLQEMENKSYTLDATFTPEPVSAVTVYYTRQDIDSRQASRYYTSANKSTANDAASAVRDWSVRTEDAVDTIGLSANRSFMEDKLTLKANMAYSRTNTATSFTAGSGIAPAPTGVPAINSWRKTFDLTGNYKMQKDLDVRVSALWELYRSDDWATDGINPGTSQSGAYLLTLTGSETDYRAFVLRTSVNYRF